MSFEKIYGYSLDIIDMTFESKVIYILLNAYADRVGKTLFFRDLNFPDHIIYPIKQNILFSLGRYRQDALKAIDVVARRPKADEAISKKRDCFGAKAPRNAERAPAGKSAKISIETKYFTPTLLLPAALS